MKITLVGPGIMPIPPTGWGAVEILVWDTKNALENLGHTVQIVNTRDQNQIISEINSFRPDFVHIHYDEFINAKIVYVNRSAVFGQKFLALRSRMVARSCIHQHRSLR
jgi:hypothetical protein